jgi:hypothetical protein
MHESQTTYLRSAARKKFICLLLILLLSIVIRIFYSSLVDYSVMGPSGQGDQHFIIPRHLAFTSSVGMPTMALIQLIDPPSIHISFHYFIAHAIVHGFAMSCLLKVFLLTHLRAVSLSLYEELFRLEPGLLGWEFG